MYFYKATVIKVVDGDTVDCEIDLGFHIKVTKRVRLAGIDTPELNSKSDLIRKAAVAAKNYVADKIGSCQFFLKTELDRSDKYGRVLGWIYLDKESSGDESNSLNHELVQNGHADWYMVRNEK